uniref:Carboxylic ester hydrolase n=1 Tax=Panagrellus redivivus TaxID=6233 RepID=A0A7E4VUU2_PANRE
MARFGLLVLPVAALVLSAYGNNAAKQRTAPVKLPEFTVRGFQEEYEGVNANVYLGIPYATPPVGDLRLEKPVPLGTSEKTIDALEYSPTCYQQENYAPEVPHSEDCLKINIITPTTPPPPEGFPVLFWIHGGGYMYGGNRLYGYRPYIRDYTSRDVIYVNFQYRIAFYGFFTTNTTANPGNLGLWDQSEALKFVKRNIKAFGGNPNQITVGGHSAGAGSTNNLVLSPITRDLFINSIQQSGDSFGAWNLRPDLVEFSKTVAKDIGCTQFNDVELKKCLKKKADPVLEKLKNYPYAPADLAVCNWSPILDAEFFGGKTVLELIAEAPVKPVIYIIDSGEGLLFTLKTNNLIGSVFTYNYGQWPQLAHRYTRENFEHDLRKLVAKEERVPKDKVEAFVNDVLINYLDANYDGKEDVYYWRRFTDVISYILFEVPIIENIRARLPYGWNNQYVLLWDYLREEDIYNVRYRAAAHGYEYPWISETSIYYDISLPFTDYENELIQTWAENIATFVKTGKPKSDWPAVTDNEHVPYLGFMQDQVEVGSTFFDHIKYWEDALVKYNVLWNSINKEPYLKPVKIVKTEL